MPADVRGGGAVQHFVCDPWIFWSLRYGRLKEQANTMRVSAWGPAGCVSHRPLGALVVSWSVSLRTRKACWTWLVLPSGRRYLLLTCATMLRWKLYLVSQLRLKVY